MQLVKRFDVAESIGVPSPSQYQLTVRINGQTRVEQTFQVVEAAAFGLLLPAQDAKLCTASSRRVPV